MRASMSSLLPSPSTIVVLSLSIVIRFARPRSLRVSCSSLMPSSSATTLPPVSIAMSFSISLRRSPKPGAFTAHTWSVPRSLFTTSVASASPSTSSATMRSGLPERATCSSTGMRSAIAEIFFSVMRMYGSSSTASMRSGFVTK